MANVIFNIFSDIPTHFQSLVSRKQARNHWSFYCAFRVRKLDIFFWQFRILERVDFSKLKTTQIEMLVNFDELKFEKILQLISWINQWIRSRCRYNQLSFKEPESKSTHSMKSVLESQLQKLHKLDKFRSVIDSKFNGPVFEYLNIY